VRDIRHGESKWVFWTGEGYFFNSHSEVVYFTNEHVDMTNDIVLRALASTLQRDGIVDSLSDGFKAVDGAQVFEGYAGILPDEKDYTVCDEHGETQYGDVVNTIYSFTWVEFDV